MKGRDQAMAVRTRDQTPGLKPSLNLLTDSREPRRFDHLHRPHGIILTGTGMGSGARRDPKLLSGWKGGGSVKQFFPVRECLPELQKLRVGPLNNSHEEPSWNELLISYLSTWNRASLRKRCRREVHSER